MRRSATVAACKFAVVIAASLFLISSTGCHTQKVVDAPQEEIDAAVEKSKEQIRDELAVMPAWYRASLVPSYSIDESKETASIVILSHTIITKKAIPSVKEPLFWPFLGLCLFIYVVFIAVALWIEMRRPGVLLQSKQELAFVRVSGNTLAEEHS